MTRHASHTSMPQPGHRVNLLRPGHQGNSPAWGLTTGILTRSPGEPVEAQASADDELE
jgi:hypothetical protein